MMKKTLLFLLFTIVSINLMVAQGKPKNGKTIPSFQKVENLSINQTNQLFEEKLQTTTQDQLNLLSSKDDGLGFVHQKYQQYYNGILVEGRTVTVHSKDGLIKHMSGNFKPMDDINTTPSLNEANGLQAAKTHVGATKYAWEGDECSHYASTEDADHHHDYSVPEGQLVIFADPNDKTIVRLAYKYDIYASQPLYRAYVYIDAQNGELLFENHRIHNTNEGGTCSTLYNGSQSIIVDNTGSNYRLRQTQDGNGIETYDLNNGTNYNNASDVTSSTSNFGASTATANQAHFGAEKTHQYFMGNHNRNSYNGAGAIIKSYVSYSTNYVNAFWDGSRMTYGDGDGVNYGPLVSLDIVGHEISHGVTEYTANLVYSYQSGALNESFSDIFGESIENYAQGNNDWLMGDAIGAGGSGGALRSMSNPNAYGDPDTYLGTNWYTGSGDNGGVHYNSGVQNKWYYILTIGESGTNDNGDAYSVAGIGIIKAGAIAYRNLSVYLSTNSQYADARTGAIQSAIDLYGAGSAEEIATTNAWYAVGVGAEYGGGGPATCVEEDVTLNLLTDNYASETSWTLTSGGSTVASGSGYANNTSYTINWNLPAGDYVFTINDSYGDGICCGYGNGSYSLTTATATIASGGSFASSETTNFCTESSGGPILGCTDPTAHNYDPAATQDDGSCETCTDGTQNGDETGVDCGGVLCAPCGGGGPTTVFAHYFESGWDGWADGGSDCYRYNGSRSWEGNRSIRIRDNSGTRSAMTSSSYDLSGFTSVDLQFYFYAHSMENGEDFWVRYYNGSSWTTVAAYARGTSFNNGTFYTATVTLSSANYNLASNAQFRFQCDASGNNDHIYIDEVTLTGTSSLSLIAATSGQTIRSVDNNRPVYGFGDLDDMDELASEKLLVYPNPATSEINLHLVEGASLIRIYTLTGSLVLEQKVDANLQENIDISSLQPGTYFIGVEVDGVILHEKFIKL